MDKPVKLYLEGLDCANCAAKLEQSLKKEGFRDVSVNFLKREATLKGDSEKAKAVIVKVEPDIQVTEKRQANPKTTPLLPGHIPALMGVAVLLFGTGLILRYGFSLSNPWVTVTFTVAYLLSGWKVLKNAGLNMIRGNLFDENFLMAVATLGAFAVGELPEAAGVMIFFMVGEYFQDLAVDRSRRSIRSLLALKADSAHLLAGERVVDVDPEDLRPGDRIQVRPGERLPVDGSVIRGSSSLDTSALTGESVPQSVREGGVVLSGSLNLNGLLTVEVTKRQKESTLARILDLVENATARKAKTEQFITSFARIYTPVVVGLALVVALLPPLAFKADFSVWVYRALVLLVISCPCALVLSIPLGYFAGIGRSAKSGILVKGSNFLDAMAATTIVALDKTGTLTKGVFKVTDVETRNGFSNDDLLKHAALAEAHSSHPIAVAVRDAWKGPLNPARITEVKEKGGSGIVARTDDMEIMVGNDRLLHEEGIEHDTCHVSGTVVHVVLGRLYAGYLVISDEVKEDGAETVRELKRLGIRKVVMVTGDNAEAAEAIAREVRVDEIHAGLLPEDKVTVIEALREETGQDGKVAFVGDGINDAPVLAMADIGIAMGGLGSDAAIETADIVILDDKPSKIARGIVIARRTRRIVTQNIVLAVGIKLIFIALGIFGEATMWEAVFADVGVALIAVGNAIRILR